MTSISRRCVFRLLTLITSSVVIVTIVSPFYSSVTLNSYTAHDGFSLSTRTSGNYKGLETQVQDVTKKIASENAHASANVKPLRNFTSLSEDRHILEEESYRYMGNNPSGNLSGNSYKVWKSMLLRNQVLEETCDQMRRPFAAGQAPSHLLVDDRNKYIFCEVRKVSSMAWRKVLDTMALAGPPTGGLKAGDRLRRLGTYSKQNREYRLRHYTKFMFVREPMLRAFSGWREKFVDGPQRHDYQTIWGPQIKRSRLSLQNTSFSSQGQHGEARSSISFADFVGYITGPVPSPLQQDMHWQSYLPRCRPCRVRYDLIGHYETLGPDAEAILGVISPSGHSNNNTVMFPPIRSSRTPNLAKREFLKLKYEDLLKLARLYELDYKLFGYSLEQFLKWLEATVADSEDT
ncbi:carbohydrate sulfotransferase 11-like [Asterias amurensis]|uniref:carbohydrate sulfotransferase 11-like n=1 Tax=Asterias amurensis TaxID=7602 RepID=UPI003AB64B94